jgi:hypothetical protein
MNARWTVSLAVCAAVLLCGALLAAAAEPTIGQKQPAVQSSAGILQNSTLMGKTVPAPRSQTRTVSVASPVNNPGTPCPLIPCAVAQPCPPLPCVVPQPCVCPMDPYAGWPESLIEFSEE